MKFKEVKEEISRIAEIEKAKECQEEVRELDYKLHKKMRIMAIDRGYNWVYFYSVLGYDEKNNKILGEQLLKINIQIYNKNKEKIEKLRIAGKVEELKKYTKNK